MIAARRALLAGVALQALGAGTHAAEFDLQRAAYHSPRFFGMGGAYVAVSDDRNLFFTNPAGLGFRARGEVFLAFPITVNTNTIDIIDFYSQNRQTFEDLDRLSDEEQGRFYDDVVDAIGGKRSEASAHLPLGVLWPSREGSYRPSLGVGFFARAGSRVLVEPGASSVPLTSLDLDVEYTGVVSAAWCSGRFLPGRWSVGGTFKIDHRRLSLTDKSLLALSENENLDVLDATAVGMDLGLLYQPTPALSAGVTVFDVLGSDFEFSGQDGADPLAVLRDGDVGHVDPALDLGLAFHPARNFGKVQHVVLALDVKQPFDPDESFWKGVHVGAEARLGWLVPRFGVFQGYVGGGFGLGPLQYAFYSNEVGHFAGSRSNYAHVLSFEFHLGD